MQRKQTAWREPWMTDSRLAPKIRLAPRPVPKLHSCHYPQISASKVKKERRSFAFSIPLGY